MTPDFEHSTLQGANAMAIHYPRQGIALDYEIHWTYNALKLKPKLEFFISSFLPAPLSSPYGKDLKQR